MLDLLFAYRLYFVAAAVSFAMAVVFTPVARRLATKLGIVDSPDKHRKLHEKATPLGGGLAVLAAFAVTVTVIILLSDSQKSAFAGDRGFVIGLSLASLTICIVGILDDRFGLRGRQKLAGQVVAAGVLVSSGLCIHGVSLFGWHVDLGLLAIPFTLFWLLGAINALNLIDGVDGLATGVGIVLSFSIAAIAGMTGHRTEAFLALAMAGALCGFLLYNKAPASIFLGDAGSMLIGLTLGALALRGSFRGAATAALAAPAAIWAIPIFDVSMAILRRRLTGRSIYETDRSHLHHQLLRRGFSSTKTSVFIGLLCVATAIGAVASVGMNNELLAFVGVGAVFASLILARFFGHHESWMLTQRMAHFAGTLVPTRKLPDTRKRQLQTRLQGNRQWDELWETLTDFADRFDLSAIQLNVTMPAIGEEFHANWERKVRPEETRFWHSDIPLVTGNITVGRLKITGACNHGNVCTWMGDLIAGLKPFEEHLVELISDCFRPTVDDPILVAEADSNSGFHIAESRG